MFRYSVLCEFKWSELYLEPAVGLGSGLGAGLLSHPLCLGILTRDQGGLWAWALVTAAPPHGTLALPPASQRCNVSGLFWETFVCFSDKKAWNLGLSNAKLSYYDGMIQLNYKDGTPYNNEKHTPRATLITFLCDRDAGVGVPEYQVGMCCVCTCVCWHPDRAKRRGCQAHKERQGRRRGELRQGVQLF